MKRVVSVYLPTFATDRFRRQAGDAAPPSDVPLVLAGQDGRRRVVLAADLAAQRAGLRVGMPLSKAQALLRDLVIEEMRPAADAEALDRLALWCLQRFAPIVAPDAPDGIVIDSTGADHLHGGEPALAEMLINRLAAVGIKATVAIADTWGAARALARHGGKPVYLSKSGHALADIAPLPIAALRLSARAIEGLRVLGFERISELLDQPRAPLTLRFGPEIARELDATLGHLADPIEPIRPNDAIEVRQAFAEPIGAAETIARYIAKLAAALCGTLEKRGVGARRLDLICHRVDNHAQAIRVGTALPLRDAKRMTRLLCDKIETIDPGFGIEVMTLAASVADPVRAQQAASSLIEEAEPDISDLIDLLANRIGARNLYRVAPVASDVPERMRQRIAAFAPDAPDQWPAGWPRPARLLEQPEEVRAIAALPDHAPATFTWRGIRRRVMRADGPERVFGEWWKRDPEMAAVRDYFQVEDEAGERFWLFRAGDGEDPLTGSHRWFLHGIFG